MNAEDMDKLVSGLERKLGREWAETVEWLRRNNKLSSVIAAIERRDIEGAIKGIEKAARQFARSINAGFQLAQQRTARWLNGELTDTIIRYDVANQRATNWMRDNTLQVVRGMAAETREMVRETIADGLAQGLNPKTIARELRDSIGLTRYQRSTVSSYRRALETGDFSNALGRELSDGRYDRTIMAAQRDGRALTRTEINGAVERYRTNAIARRAETIARTEAIRSAHQGQRELFNEAIADGDITEDQLVRRWVHYNAGKHARDFHQTMHNQTRGHNEPFVSGLGNKLMFPGDPEAPPEETINCRCTITVRYIRGGRARRTFERESRAA